MYLSEILSSFICGKPDFDPQVRYLAKRSIVDTMGAMLAGSCTDVVKQLLPVYNAPGCCTLVGLKGTVSANNAAFLNGISGHELELDDTSSSNLGHPTVAVLPSVLAAGEERAASGEEVLKAFILATEVECKIGRICAAELHRRGWHASSITGVLRAGGDVFWSAALDLGPQWCIGLPLTALCALVLKTGIWPIAIAMQLEYFVKVPLCEYRVRSRKWIHDVTMSRREEP